MAWLTGWTYRKPITLSHASGALTSYQMKLLVGESSGATGEAVDCNSHCLASFNDLRFTKSDGTTLLDYWIESITGSTPNQLATVWIEFDSIGTTDTTFYLYYGFDAPSGVMDATWNLTKYASNPVLAVGAGGAWDDFWAVIHSIWKEGSTYYGYYNGRQSGTAMQIGLATSTDGITWTKNGGNPVLAFGAAGKWDDAVVGSPLVWKEDSTWYMLFNGARAGGVAHIGLATSSDGIAWTRYDANNPVMAAGSAGAWDDFLLSPGTLMLKEENVYYLYYEGSASSDQATRQIGLATSSDLHTWTRSGNNPIITPVGSGNEYGVGEPCVKKFGPTYWMWYQMVGDDANYDRTRIGIASSASKDSGWSKGTNPHLDNGPATWDDHWTETPLLVQVGTVWRLYYGGSHGSAATPRMQTGYATYGINMSTKGVATFPLFDNFDDGSVSASLWDTNGTPTESGTILTLNQAEEGIKSKSTFQYKRFRASINMPSNTTSGYRNWAGFKNAFDQNAGDTAHVVAVGANPTLMYEQSYKTGTEGGSQGAGFTGAYVTFQIDRLDASTIKFYFNDVLKATHTTQIPTSSLSAWLFAAIAGNYYEGFTADWVFIANLDPTEPAWGSWGEESGEAVAYTQTLSDGFTISDSFGMFSGLLKGDSLSLSDSSRLGVGKSASDGYSLSEGIAMVFRQSLGDGLTLQDAISKTTLQVIADNLSIQDSISKLTGITQADDLTLLDLVSAFRGLALALSDTISLSDDARMAFDLGLSDQISLSDVQAKVAAFILDLADTITLSDEIVIPLERSETYRFIYEKTGVKITHGSSTRFEYEKM
jgi:predicted GH43/DUF377 family glycosyl hydrolase